MRAKNLPTLVGLSVVYIFGGALQLFDLISPTQSNIVALLLLTPLVILNKKRNCKTDLLLYLFFSYLLITGLTNDSQPLSFAVYIYYFATLLISIKSAPKLISDFKIDPRSMYKIAIFFSIFQLLVSILQNIFAKNISAIADIAPEDAISGSFYIKSDATLSYFFILLTITSFLIFERRRQKITIALLSLVIIFLANSKASQILFIFVSLALIPTLLKVKSHSAKIISIILILLLSIILTLIFIDQISTLYLGTLSKLQEAFYEKDRFDEASRLAPIGEILYGSSNLFGYGLLTYYNPISKTWHYYSGFSLLYSLYFDSGILAIPLFILWLIKLIYSKVRKHFYSWLYISVIASYSLFNFTFTDIGLLLSLGLFITLIEKNQSSQNEKALYSRN